MQTFELMYGKSDYDDRHYKDNQEADYSKSLKADESPKYRLHGFKLRLWFWGFFESSCVAGFGFFWRGVS